MTKKTFSQWCFKYGIPTNDKTEELLSKEEFGSKLSEVFNATHN